jgi:hypothetical protein
MGRLTEKGVLMPGRTEHDSWTIPQSGSLALGGCTKCMSADLGYALLQGTG